MIRSYENVTLKDVKNIIEEERKNIGKLHPVTDNRFKICKKGVLLKYAEVYDMPSPSENKGICIDYEMARNEEGNIFAPAEMWNMDGEYVLCKESCIIGWAFKTEVDELFMN